MENNNEIQKETTPPYVPFLTFLNALKSLTEHGVPGQIDKSVLSNFSGGTQRQLFPALRFMGFINENDEPTDSLEQYANADTEGQKTILKNNLADRYPDQINILPNGTAQQLKDSFNYIDLKSSVKDKCITFFLKTAEYRGKL